MYAHMACMRVKQAHPAVFAHPTPPTAELSAVGYILWYESSNRRRRNHNREARLGFVRVHETIILIGGGRNGTISVKPII